MPAPAGVQVFGAAQSREPVLRSSCPACGARPPAAELARAVRQAALASTQPPAIFWHAFTNDR